MPGSGECPAKCVIKGIGAQEGGRVWLATLVGRQAQEVGTARNVGALQERVVRVRQDLSDPMENGVVCALRDTGAQVATFQCHAVRIRARRQGNQISLAASVCRGLSKALAEIVVAKCLTSHPLQLWSSMTAWQRAPSRPQRRQAHQLLNHRKATIALRY
eukprot:2499865-Rhodomonas_salina.1